MVLTVNGSAAIVVQDANTYQKLLDRVEALEAEQHFIAAVNEGLADVKAGRVKPFREAFAEAENDLAFSVKVADLAMLDAEDYRAFILRHSHDSLPADAWWKGLFEAIATLEDLPSRCPRIPEHSTFPDPLRHLLYASHRIVFSVDHETVTVVRIYHGSFRPLRSLSQRPKLKESS